MFVSFKNVNIWGYLCFCANLFLNGSCTVLLLLFDGGSFFFFFFLSFILMQLYEFVYSASLCIFVKNNLYGYV